MEEFLTPRDVGYGHGLVQASIVFPGTRADVDKDTIIEAMGVEGYFFATMVYLVDDPNHNFGLLPECSGMYSQLQTYIHHTTCMGYDHYHYSTNNCSLQDPLQVDLVWILVWRRSSMGSQTMATERPSLVCLGRVLSQTP